MFCSGGSGAVFSFSTSNRLNSHFNTNEPTIHGNNDRIAIKVGWKQSSASVENECNILQSLEGVPHVVRCLGHPNPYPHEDGRTMIALTPVVASAGEKITSSVRNLKPGSAQNTAVKCIVETMIGMLKSGVYTIDVQPLIDMDSGELIFIDFTEANHFSNPLTPTDESGLIGFCGEMLALIPDSLKDVAAEMLRRELSGFDNKMMTPLPEKVDDLVERIWFE
jgi:hypothetical protein